MFDIIGDVHGYANSLIAILELMGYENSSGYYKHKTRKAIFTGDFIDRGPKIAKTLEIVKAMVENHSAYAIMGNHEYNAICYHLKDKNGLYLREHSEKNKRQYRLTLNAFKTNRTKLFEYINWFKTLPLFLEFDNLRIIHACWDPKVIDYLKKSLVTHTLNWNFLIKSSNKETEEYKAIDIILKGKELRLPKTVLYIDNDGIRRKSVRIKWWKEFKNETYRSIAVNFSVTVPEVLVEKNAIKDHIPYGENEVPVFMGHFWRKGDPEAFTPNVCCVDYSVARHGKLVAYRWDGEQKIDKQKFVSVKSIT